MLYVLAWSLGGGRDEGLRATAGTGIGGLVHVAAAAAGLSAIIATSATTCTVVKHLGRRTVSRTLEDGRWAR
jgi:threonine/homoserine/homoserine lactone efflux protein